MTILTACTCGFVLTSSGAAIPAAVGGTAGVVVTGVKLWIHSEPIKVALSTAIGSGISSGAIVGPMMSKTVVGAVPGAVAGGFASAGVGSVLAGSLMGAGGVMSSSPIGLLTVGTHYDGNKATFDCWKSVLHDTSKNPSSGMSLSDLAAHPNVSNVEVTQNIWLPKIVIENVWNERFEIEYVLLKDQLYCHANPIDQ